MTIRRFTESSEAMVLISIGLVQKINRENLDFGEVIVYSAVKIVWSMSPRLKIYCRKLNMKSDLNLSIVNSVNSTHSLVNSVNSTHSLFSSHQSMTDLAALFAVKGWVNPAQGIWMTESIAQEKQQRLIEAFERYVEQPNSNCGYELMAQLHETQADLTAEYNYAKKKQAFYQVQVEQEAKSGGGIIADWTQWLWHGMQDFLGSSNAALAEKY